MEKRGFSRVNARAATIAGGIAGFLFWIFGVGVGFSGMPMYGFMASVMGSYSYGMMGYYYGYPSFAAVYLIALVVTGAIFGAIIGAVYNWALKLK